MPPQLPGAVQELVEALPWVARVALAVGITMLGIGWISAACHWAPRSPAARLAAASPACALNVVLPLLFVAGSEPLSRAFSIFLISWLASFKALALAVGRGPLAMQRWTLPQLWALYALPLVPAGGSTQLRRRPSQLQGSPPRLLLRWAAKVGATAAVVFGLLRHVQRAWRDDGRPRRAAAAPAGPPARPPLPAPPGRAPSIAEFWGVRWNQAAGSALRTTIYEPIAEGRLVRHDRLAALASGGGGGGTYLTGAPTQGLSWLIFFTGQAALIAAEQWALAQARQAGVAVPAAARRALTLGVLLACGHFYFFQPAEAAGMPDVFATSMRQSFAALASPLRRRLR
ncbi:putative long-chain-alcohol O-fatty-acyltransferase 5 [Micractinium conductrix]|uniref:Long-chain-alcohol O-fatty-acyltransferase 5 n=1 Tax=Micractinium conductrix TaxID=554055 RepID=A0A2P6VJY7_9CHLO|nr:putative long-chain-alcohol O-fatty-acyltransferase 5 [Micractinium conductrix]|eukprot:PSC74403.1 putative long-chain-alcohol O-fatty-acyltransferase 5 [Micractinium conductrix]